MATPILADFPETLNIYPIVGLKSFRSSEASGAWRLFVLAKNMVGQLDHIKRDDLKRAATSLGVNDKQFYRWMIAARNYDFFKDVQRKGGEWMLIIAGIDKAMQSLECESKGVIVSIPTKALFRKSWRAYVFASWQSSFTDNGKKLVSQKKQAELTGINPQTQRQYNKQAGVESKKNFAISNIHANGYAGVLEFSNRAALFQYWDKATHQKKLGWRIPDSRVFPLYDSNSSYKTPKTMSLFNRTPEQYAASTKAIRKQDNDVKEIYVFDKVSQNGNNLWTHLPIN